MKTELAIGRTYNKWTVLGFDRVDEKRRRRYNCRCQCGRESSVIASAVAAGRSKSCPRCKAEDLTDQRFGLWTVISRSDSVSKGTGYKTLWECECVCGNRHLVERCNLVKGNSEGCWKCRRNVIEANRFPKIWYRKFIEQAKSRGHEVGLTEDELWSIWESQKGICPLSGLSIAISESGKETTASPDRICNAKGYVEGNVWFTHKHINMMKFKYETGYFKMLCEAVATTSREQEEKMAKATVPLAVEEMMP